MPHEIFLLHYHNLLRLNKLNLQNGEIQNSYLIIKQPYQNPHEPYYFIPMPGMYFLCYNKFSHHCHLFLMLYRILLNFILISPNDIMLMPCYYNRLLCFYHIQQLLKTFLMLSHILNFRNKINLNYFKLEHFLFLCCMPHLGLLLIYRIFFFI